MSDSLKDISKLKVADLKRELKVRGHSTVGNKQELQDRLQLVLQDGTDTALLLDDTGTVDTEDILNEDDVLADEDDSNTPPTPTGVSPLKRQLDEELDEDAVTSTPAGKANASQAQDGGPPAKKITLNRKVLSQSPPVPSETTEGGKKSEDSSDEKKVVKLSEISMKERLALRAVKFGAPASADAKKVARTERFGQPASADSKKDARAARFGASASSVTSAGNVPEVNVDVLKKRAERFGIQPGSKIEKVEMEDKKKKRLERFGNAPGTATNGSSKTEVPKSDSPVIAPKPGRIPITAPTSSATSKSSLDDKKKLRAERFKTNSAVTAK